MMQVLHDRALCYFQRQALGRQFMFLEYLHNIVGQVLIEQVTCGQVHRYLQHVTGFLPMPTLAYGLGNDILGQRHDRARALGGRHEVVRLQEPKRRVFPSHQGFSTAHIAIRQRYLRLVPDLNFAAAQGGREIIDDSKSTLEFVFTAQLINAHALIAGLGVSARDRGQAQQISGRRSVPRKFGNTRLRLQDHTDLSQCNSGTQQTLDPVHVGHCGVSVLPWQHDDEFVGTGVAKKLQRIQVCR